MSQDAVARIMRRILGRVCLFLFVLPAFCGASRAFAQMDQGTITGVVQDTTKAAIPGASVTLVNRDTNLTLHGKTDGSGVYVFTPIKIGTYSVSASFPGFEQTTQQNIVVDVQSNVDVPITLHAGNVSETVTVTTAPPLLQTQSAVVGTTFTNAEVNNTPLNSRNWIYMAQLVPGVAPSTDGNTEASGNGDFSANGQRPGQNNFTLDGIDNNINTVDLRGGASYAIRPPPDAIAEFRLSTTNFSAQFGHSAGALFNASIKSGTNQIHGDVWEYFRNTALDAEDWEDLVKDVYHENQFGATIGGPIWKDHIFYFGDGEANRIIYGSQAALFSVPSLLERQGNFNEVTNVALTGLAQPTIMYQPNSSGTQLMNCNGVANVLCPSAIDPVAQNLLDMYPKPNIAGGLLYNNYRPDIVIQDNTDQTDQRFDFNLTPKDQFFVRYSFSHQVLHNPPPFGPVLDGSTTNLGYEHVAIIQSVVASTTHFFSPNFSNEARFGYNFLNERFLSINAYRDIAPSVGLGGLPFGQPGYQLNGGLPHISIGSVSDIGTHEYSPTIEHQNIDQYLDNLSDVIGNHSLKLGVAFQSIRNNFLQPTYSLGNYGFSGKFTSNLNASFTGNGIADFLTDQTNTASLANQPIGNDVRWYESAYIEDDWRIRHNLTLNLGLRYDYFQPYREMANQQANVLETGTTFIPGGGAGIFELPVQDEKIPLQPVFTNGLATDHLALQYERNNRLSYAPKTNFAPRVGFAYAIDPKTVFRGGFGIFYGALETFGSAWNLIQNYPFTFSATLNSGACSATVLPCADTGVNLETGFQQALAVGPLNYFNLPGLTATDLHPHTSYAYGFNFTFEEALSSSTVMDIAYVSTYSRRNATQEDTNAATVVRNPNNTSSTVEPFPQFGSIEYITDEGQSDYNSLQASINKRMSHGLNFMVNYTWAHSLDDSKSPIGGGPTDRNPVIIPDRLEYTNSTFDVRNRFNLNLFYELPFGVGRGHLNHKGLADKVLGGWASDLTVQLQTGFPFNIAPNVTTASGGNAYAIKVGNPFHGGGTAVDPYNNIPCPAHVRNRTNWYNPCAYVNPLPGGYISQTTGPGGSDYVPEAPCTVSPANPTGCLNPSGQPYQYPVWTAGIANAFTFLGGKQDTIYGPGIERVNMSFFKDWKTVKRQFLQFRVDIFNVPNHPSFANPNIQTLNPNGGQIAGPHTLQQYTPDARFFQLALKYVF